MARMRGEDVAFESATRIVHELAAGAQPPLVSIATVAPPGWVLYAPNDPSEREVAAKLVERGFGSDDPG